jgi:signal transduction histidine kinase
MLSDLDDLHHSLRQRVAAATAELQVRNDQLVRSYESISQLRETAARAQQLAAVGQTLANVAHQIGTPLNLISGHVQLLRQETTDPAVERRLRIVEEQAERMASTLRTLLERARPDEERRPVHIGEVLAASRSRRTSASRYPTCWPTRRNWSWRCSTSSPTRWTRCQRGAH